MHIGKGQIVELILQDGQRAARISCPANLTPSVGQYLLASDASDAILSLSKGSPLPVPVYYTDSAPQGFIAAPIPNFWMPGMEISLRGPLGNGFVLPVSARKVALIAFDDSPSRLRGLIQPALGQGAAVVFVNDSRMENLPDEVEIQPLSAMSEIIEWADYAAFDVTRENLPRLMEMLGEQKQVSALSEAEILIRTPVPCGGVAECGVCAVTTKSGWKMACKDGPVFKLFDFPSPIGRG
jgi:dihydroorotate dehydrogenase electron transfer subunit